MKTEEDGKALMGRRESALQHLTLFFSCSLYSRGSQDIKAIGTSGYPENVPTPRCRPGRVAGFKALGLGGQAGQIRQHQPGGQHLVIAQRGPGRPVSHAVACPPWPVSRGLSVLAWLAWPVSRGLSRVASLCW